MVAIPDTTPLLVVGAGPAGLLAALQLACHGIPCTLIERNNDTTKWPKMDITNCRSMELFNRLGISEDLRSIGVPQRYSLDVIFSFGLSEGGEVINKWITAQNDGSMPREPYQRCSQAIFEAWLKPRIQEEPLITSIFGVKLESVTEDEDGTSSRLVEVATGQQHEIRSEFVVGCDGAGSRVRKSLGIELIGGPVPGAMLLDEVDTWTTHLPVPVDADWQSIDPADAISKVLGGSCAPLKIEIDQILVKSVWRPNICIAERYTSRYRRVFLSGDAAHQNIPTGGYGMNTAVGDSFDIGWKLAAVLKGYGGSTLLESYELERKPVAVRNIERSGVHHTVHAAYIHMVMQSATGLVTSRSNAGVALRQKIKEHTTAKEGENKDHGIELDYRYNGSPIVIPDGEEPEPKWNERDYTPSTWPGARPPHVFLKDGTTSIFDLFGPEYTIVDFTREGAIAASFTQAAGVLGIPIKPVHLPDEPHVANVWGRPAVLIRPHDHVAWRSTTNPVEPVDAEHILKITTGNQPRGDSDDRADIVESIREKGVSGTVGIEKHDAIQTLGVFQM